VRLKASMNHAPSPSRGFRAAQLDRSLRVSKTKSEPREPEGFNESCTVVFVRRCPPRSLFQRYAVADAVISVGGTSSAVQRRVQVSAQRAGVRRLLEGSGQSHMLIVVIAIYILISQF
jgi:hypothetical protein